MNKKTVVLLTTTLTLTLMLTSRSVSSQSISVLATDLKAPIKIILTAAGNLLVAEAGNGANTGCLPIVDRRGNRRALLDGLPSSARGPSGPPGLALSGRTLFLSIGNGDATVAGPRPGSEVPNPNGPSSPLLSSVLSVEFGSNIDALTGGFRPTTADHFRLANGLSVTLSNQSGDRAIVNVLADFRDYLPDPNTIVRSSNPFGLALRVNTLYVVDAAQNSVVRVNVSTGRAQTVFTFARVANPTPVGPPMIDPVPDSIRLFGVFGEKLLVPMLTGFPFPPGAAEVRQVDLVTGAIIPFITGLTSAIDVLPVGHPLVNPQFFVLEFSTNMTAEPAAPGRLQRFDSPTATPVVIADTLISPTSMAYDPRTRELFVTEIFTGRIIRVQGL